MRIKRSEPINVEQLMSTARDLLSVRRVFGDPIDHNGVRVIPAARVRGGGGGGGGGTSNGETGRDDSGGGGGFGMIASPAGALVIKGDQVTWRPAANPERIALAGIAFASFFVWSVRSVLKRRRG